MPPTDASSRALSRRLALGLATVVPLAAVAGCSAADAHGRLDAGVDRLRAPRSTPPAPANPDQPLVDAAVGAIADLRATLLPHRTADPVIRDLVHLHASHLKALGAASASGTPVPLDGSAAGSTQVVGAVMLHEQTLVTLLADKAVRAHDGDLARLLASMSAAVAQRTGGASA